MKTKISRKKDNCFSKVYVFILTLISSMIFILHCYRRLNIDNTQMLELIDKFTYQSNIWILIVMCLFFTSLRYKKIFSILMFIAAINIFLTFSMVHLILFKDEKTELLRQLKEKIIFLDIKHYQHTIIPILYLIFYFFRTNPGLNIKKAYLGIIYPLCYFFFYLFANISNLFKNKYYPYDIINPEKPGIFNIKSEGGQGYFYLFLAIIFLTIIYYFLSVIILFLKNKIKFVR
ncbi:hypothetical protein [Candidatus Phytoplasma fraxini]|uniref:Integral membrane protein n=1 Tax=Ash yellows phytoplasma TaxID=35780 RepID=A0ABZ2UDG4_ASHYP